MGRNLMFIRGDLFDVEFAVSTSISSHYEG